MTLDLGEDVLRGDEYEEDLEILFGGSLNGKNQPKEVSDDNNPTPSIEMPTNENLPNVNENPTHTIENPSNDDNNTTYVNENITQDNNNSIDGTDASENRSTVNKNDDIEKKNPLIGKTCISCSHGFDANDFVISCVSCNFPNHADCTINGLCGVCRLQENIQNRRNEAVVGQKRKADKMLERTAKQMLPASVGDTVMIPLLAQDRGRLDPKNVPAFVISDNGSSTYKLGTKYGVLDHLYTRNQFEPTLEKFMTPDDVDSSQTITLRKASRAQSVTGTLGTKFKCTCGGKCIDKRCQCFRNNLKCNSSCHGHRICVNRDK